MLKSDKIWLSILSPFLDLVTVALSWWLAYQLRAHVLSVWFFKPLPSLEKYLILLPLLFFIWSSVFIFSGLYQIEKVLFPKQEGLRLLKAHGISLLIFFSLTYFLSEYRYSRAILLVYGVVSLVFLWGVRKALRFFVRKSKGKHNTGKQKVFFVGSGKTIEKLGVHFERYPELGYVLEGTFSWKKEAGSLALGTLEDGSFEGFFQALFQRAVQVVFVVFPPKGGSEVTFYRFLSKLSQEGIEIKLVPDFENIATLAWKVEILEGIPVLAWNSSPLSSWAFLAKRVTDMVLSFLALIFFAPWMVLIAIGIKWTSKGPVFYRQERMGLDGKVFWMLKFRSMRVDAELKTGPKWAQAADARCTPFGRFLRATSLDELPQFLNVLKGEMSLVGPRPERPYFVQKFKNKIPSYMLRHKMKAGITGWAQVHGWRGNTSLEKRIEYDLYYIRNWSYFLDWKILILTIFQGFMHKNAY